MSISAKPQNNPVDINALINKGGSVPAKKEEKKELQPKNIQLRLYSDVISRIDEARKNRLVKPSRHSWLLEAIMEKLTKEEM